MKVLARAVVVCALFATVLVPTVPDASAAGGWAPAAKATIHPGVQTFTAGAQCTANFVFRSASAVYIGQAAHCSGTGDSTETDGCTSKSLPLGTRVKVANVTGTMVYNSWITMQKLREKGSNVCAYNDLALIKLPASAVAKVNPSVPFWGGPTGLGGATPAGAKVYSYGNSELRGGNSTLSPKQGVSLGDEGGGWSHSVYTASPACPATRAAGSSTRRARQLACCRRSRSRRRPGATGSATSHTSSRICGHTRACASRWCAARNRSGRIAAPERFLGSARGSSRRLGALQRS